MNQKSDKDTERQLREIAATLVDLFLANRSALSWGKLRLPSGYTRLSMFYQLIDDAALVALLAEIAQQTTSQEEGGVWTFSVCDPALANRGDLTRVVLHRVNVDVSALDEVPADVFIFGLGRTAPYTLCKLQPLPPRQITNARLRRMDEELFARVHAEMRDLREHLLDIARRELAQQEHELPNAVVRLVREKLNRASAATQSADTQTVMEALCALGMLPQLFPDFPQR